ncbi:hypothetical protein J6590_007938 [Homalodisca vitripennis]|nr:hypothetical protein J6590_007938 [Homalodisca vitripennis]
MVCSVRVTRRNIVPFVKSSAHSAPCRTALRTEPGSICSSYLVEKPSNTFSSKKILDKPNT